MADLKPIEIAGDNGIGEDRECFLKHISFSVTSGEMGQDELTDVHLSGELGSLGSGEVGSAVVSR